MAKGAHDFRQAAYVFGIISIVMAFLSPVAGIVFGVIGLIFSKKQKSDLSERAKTLNIIGMAIGIVVLILSVSLAAYFGFNSTNPLNKLG